MKCNSTSKSEIMIDYAKKFNLNLKSEVKKLIKELMENKWDLYHCGRCSGDLKRACESDHFEILAFH